MESNVALYRANAIFAPPVVHPRDFVGVVNVLLKERAALPAGAIFEGFSCKALLKPNDLHEVAFYRGRQLVSINLISDFVSPVAFFHCVVSPFVLSCVSPAPVDPVAAEYLFWLHRLKTHTSVVPVYVLRGSSNVLRNWRLSVVEAVALLSQKHTVLDLMRLCNRFAELESV